MTPEPPNAVLIERLRDLAHPRRGLARGFPDAQETLNNAAAQLETFWEISHRLANCLRNLGRELYEDRYERGKGLLPCCYDALQSHDDIAAHLEHHYSARHVANAIPDASEGADP